MELATIRFDYTSSRGEKTTRTVDVKSFGDHDFEGYCHLRKGRRSFIYKYIKDCVDVATGNCIDNVFKLLVEKLRKYKCSTSCEEVSKFLFLEHDFFVVLVYVGRLSGQLAKRKKMVIVDACCELHGDRFISIHDLDFLANGVSYFNNENEFIQSVESIVDEERRSIIINAAEKIAAIPKDPCKEKAIVKMLKERFVEPV